MKHADIRFLSTDEVIEAHTIALEAGGGTDGIRDRGQVEAAAVAPQNAYYDTLADLASVYTLGIAESQAFLDGNKRSGLMAGLLFLQLNGYRVTLDIERAEVIMIGLAVGSHTREDLAAMFTEAMGGDPIVIED